MAVPELRAQEGPKTKALCSVSFERDKKRPARVDNEAKACLDDVALAAQSHSDATIVVVGNSAAGGQGVPDLAAQRAANVKDYLTKEKGLDGSRVRVRRGSLKEDSLQNYLVPNGSEFDLDVPGTQPANEKLVKPQKKSGKSY